MDVTSRYLFWEIHGNGSDVFTHRRAVFGLKEMPLGILCHALLCPWSGMCRNGFVWTPCYQVWFHLFLLLILFYVLSFSFWYNPIQRDTLALVLWALCLLIQCWLLVKGIWESGDNQTSLLPVRHGVLKAVIALCFWSVSTASPRWGWCIWEELLYHSSPLQEVLVVPWYFLSWAGLSGGLCFDLGCGSAVLYLPLDALFL